MKSFQKNVTDLAERGEHAAQVCEDNTGRDLLRVCQANLSQRVCGRAKSWVYNQPFQRFAGRPHDHLGNNQGIEAERRLPDECVFCRTTTDLETDHLIPRSRGGTDNADNLALACKRCNTSRGKKGIFEWLGLKKKDNLHGLVAGKYLKELLELHKVRETLDVHEEEIQRLCAKCGLGRVCREAGTEQKLTCFCLESVLE